MKMLPRQHQHIRFYRTGCDVYLIFGIFYYTTRFIYALKFAVAMTIANMGYQALCLYIDNSFAITQNIATLGRANWCLYVYCRIVIDE